MPSFHWLRRPTLLPGRPSDPARLYLRLAGLSGFANTAGLVLYAYYAVRVAELSPLELVLAGTVLELAAFLFEIPTGVIADLISRRFSVIVGYLLVGLGFLLMGAAPEFWAIAGGQFVWGVGFTFISGAREVWLADEVGDDAAGPLYPAFARRRQVGALLGGFVGVGIGWWWAAGTLLTGGVLYAAAGVYLMFVMTERGFAPAPREGRANWRTPFEQAAAGLRAARASGGGGGPPHDAADGCVVRVLRPAVGLPRHQLVQWPAGRDAGGAVLRPRPTRRATRVDRRAPHRPVEDRLQ